jgi:PAS domain S-box-containing protein
VSDAPLVLNVDDYEAARYARTKLLQQAGFRVLEAGSAKDTLRLIQAERPAVAIVDVRLPDMHGSELCRRIKADPATAHVIVLHTSAVFRGGSDRVRGLEQGADAYLVEPVEPEVLVATLRALLRTRRAEDAVRLAATEWQLTFEAISDGACFVDADGRISRCNARFRALLGTDADLLGRAIAEVTPDLAVAAAGAAWEREVERDGRVLRVAVTPVPAEIRAGGGSVWIVTDVTERKRVLALEQRARAEAEAANRTKDEFLAVLSHELRTPLTSMLGWLRMLRRGRLDAAGIERAYDVLERSTRLQTQIVEDLLDVSRVISGKMALSLAPVSLRAVIEGAVEAVRAAAAAKGLTIVTEVEPALRLIGDAARLEQVFANLLSNAVKFTPPQGRIDVRATSGATGLVVAVADTGQGISADVLPYVFEPFRQAEGTYRRVHTGLGLGLAIVRHLVELHGGTVGVASDGPGRGSTFTVVLPSDVAAVPTAEVPEVGDARGADLRGLRVLVVEDEDDTREILDMLLRESGAEVEAVGDAAAALRAVHSVRPDVLISDIGMPEVDGYDLIRQIRRLAPDAGGRTPAIALTAFAHGADHREALRAGYDRHLPKPVDATTLTRVVRDVLYARS